MSLLCAVIKREEWKRWGWPLVSLVGALEQHLGVSFGYSGVLLAVVSLHNGMCANRESNWVLGRAEGA